jgi:TonB family protein
LKPDAPSAAQTRGVRLCRALTFGIGLTVLARSVVAQELRLEFDIPAQPLPTALERYANITGRDVLYNSNLTIGRRSRGVKGHLSSDSALTTLLEETGLSARHLTQDSFVLLPTPPALDAATSPAVGQYYGQIQASLRTALCSDDETRPGNYRIAIRFWVDPIGNVARYERVGSVGAPGLDERFDRTVRRLRFGVPPPPGLAQPVTIVVVPQAPGVTMGCGTPAMRRATVAP